MGTLGTDTHTRGNDSLGKRLRAQVLQGFCTSEASTGEEGGDPIRKHLETETDLGIIPDLGETVGYGMPYLSE